MAKEKISISLPPALAETREKISEELAVKQAVRDMLMSMASGQKLKAIVDAARGAEKSARSMFSGPTGGLPETPVTPATGSIAKGLVGSPSPYKHPLKDLDLEVVEHTTHVDPPTIKVSEEGDATYAPEAHAAETGVEYHDDPDKEWFTLREGAPMKSEKPPEAPPKSKPKKADPREDVVAELLGEEGDPLGLKGIEVKDQGGWSYEFMRDGSIKILTAPKKNKKAIGLVLTKGKAYGEIKEKFKSEWLEAQGYPMSDDKEKSVSDLINDWKPETEEGMRYKQELFDVVRKA